MRPSGDRSPQSFEEALFRLLTRLYPRAFRARYGRELEAFFRAERSRSHHRGPAGALLFWRKTLRDLSVASMRGRVHSLPRYPLMRPSDLLRHLTLSLRSLRTQPGFAAMVTLTLAVGIAAMLVVFALIDAALIEALPFAGGDRIVFVQGTPVTDRTDVRGASLNEIRAWQEQTKSFSALTPVDTNSLNLELGDGTRQVTNELVGGDYFEIFQVTPLLGRVLGPEDDRVPDGHPVVVIHEQLWEEQFDRDPDVLGRTVRLNDAQLTVVGVVPRHFGGTNLDTLTWVPIMNASIVGSAVDELGWGNRWLFAVARLRDGMSMEAAQADLDAVALDLAARQPENNSGRTGSLSSARSLYLGPTEQLLPVLLIASAVLLLVATTNAAGVMTVRSAARRDEHAICLALGAGRASLAARALVDALVLATLAAGVSWVLASWALGTLVANLPAGALPPFADPRLDGETLLFAFGLVAVAALLSGLFPAFQSARGDLTTALRDVRTAASGGERRFWRSPQQLLVVAEVAIAVVLLVGTGLMGRTLLEKIAVDEGFDAEGLSAVRVRLTRDGYGEAAARTDFAARVQQRLEALPGVETVTYGSDLPLRGGTSASIVATDPTRPGETGVRFYRHRVATDYREVLGIELLRGRDFASGDVDGAPVVVQVSREFADRFLGGPDAAVGRTLLLYPGFGDVSAEVIGVVGAVRWRDLTSDVTAGDDDPDVYFHYSQSPVGVIDFALRTRPGAEVVLPQVEEAVRDVDPGVPAYLMVSLEDRVRLQTAGDRLSVAVLATFAASALLLAGIGVYGALASAVAIRRRDIAIRLALGATAERVRRTVLGQGAKLTAVGVAIGSAVALVISRWLADVLFGVATFDLSTYGAVVGLLLIVSVLATWIPAMRATRVEPQRTL